MIHYSAATDVYENLALEEYLLQRAGQGPHLLWYRNDRCVVIGKNQIPWRECRIDRLEALGGRLARRISGGGSVYHDLGNLNFCLVFPRALYRARDVLDLLYAVLSRFGLEASAGKRYALYVQGRKVSGQAFAYRAGGVLHHGTLLIDADLRAIQSLFPGMLNVIETHAVGSVPDVTVNLSSIVETLTWQDVADALRDEFVRRWGKAAGIEMEDPNAEELQALKERLQSWDWIYGQTPAFVAVCRGLRIRVEHGRVAAVEPISGSTPRAMPDPYMRWVGAPFEELERALREQSDS